MAFVDTNKHQLYLYLIIKHGSGRGNSFHDVQDRSGGGEGNIDSGEIWSPSGNRRLGMFQVCLLNIIIRMQIV